MSSRKGKMSIGSLGKVDATPQVDATTPADATPQVDATTPADATPQVDAPMSLQDARAIVDACDAYMAMVETQRAPFRILADAGIDIASMLVQVGLDYDAVNAHADATWPNLADAKARIAYADPSKFGDIRTAAMRELPEHDAMVAAIAAFRAAMPPMPDAPKSATIFESVCLGDGLYSCRVEYKGSGKRAVKPSGKPRATSASKMGDGYLEASANGYLIAVLCSSDGAFTVNLKRDNAIVYQRAFVASDKVSISAAVNDALQRQDDVSAKTRYSMRTLFGDAYDKVMGITA